MRTTLLGSLTAACLILASADVANAAAAPAAANVIRYGIDDEANISRLSQVIAEQKGFFAREGVRVQLVPFGDSFRTRTGQGAAATGAAPMTIRQGMANGTIDMSRQQFPLLVVDVMERGGKSIAVSAVVASPAYFLVVRPDIKTYADLKGKPVSITGPQDGITLWTRKLLEMHGLKREEIVLKQIAGSGARLDCVKSGECGGSALAQPSVFPALEAGAHSLGTTNEIGPFLYQFDIVNPVWAAAHRDTVVKYIRANTAANRFIMDPRNREELVRITMGFMKEPENRSRQMITYIQDPKNRVLPGRPEIDMNMVRQGIALMGEYGAVKQPLPAPERFVDPSFSRAAGP